MDIRSLAAAAKSSFCASGNSACIPLDAVRRSVASLIPSPSRVRTGTRLTLAECALAEKGGGVLAQKSTHRMSFCASKKSSAAYGIPGQAGCGIRLTAFFFLGVESAPLEGQANAQKDWVVKNWQRRRAYQRRAAGLPNPPSVREEIPMSASSTPGRAASTSVLTTGAFSERLWRSAGIQ